MYRYAVPLVVVAAASALLAPPASAEARTVFIAAFTYQTTPTVVIQGDSLTLTNTDPINHSFTCAGLVCDSGVVAGSVGAPASVEVVGVPALAAGNYDVFCKIHGFMAGVLVVAAPIG